MPNAVKRIPICLLTLALIQAAQAQTAPSSGAAAISDAVREGGNPYRPPAAATASPEEAKRARCEGLLDELSGTSKRRPVTSPGTATQSAQGRSIPKLERDDTRKQLEETYRANCT